MKLIHTYTHIIKTGGVISALFKMATKSVFTKFDVKQLAVVIIQFD